MSGSAITVLPYDPHWAEQFRIFRGRLSDALLGVPVITIEHVGSTSVPGLAAKPIIDIDIVVSPADMDAASSGLEVIGFVARGDLGIRERLAFHPPAEFRQTHVYVVVEGCLSLRNHLAVRAVLREHPELANEYAAVKHRLAESTTDSATYTRGKTAILQRVLCLGNLTPAELQSIEQANTGS